MSKIRIDPPAPKAPPAPPQRTQQQPQAALAFSLQSKQASANTALAQRQHTKNVAQARTVMQNLERDRDAAARREQAQQQPAAMPDLPGQPNAFTRFDFQNGTLAGGFFAEFSDARGGSGKEDPSVHLERMLGIGALDEPLDCLTLAKLLPNGANNGIFEVIFPTGDRLGVVVNGQGSSLSYMLSPSNQKFSSKLRRQKMELEERLEQLTHRNVNITVL